MAEYPEEVYADPMFGGTTKLYKYKGAWLNDLMYPNLEKIEQVRNMDVRSSDVMVVSFPKSGTTWMQEIAWKISCIKHPDLVARETGDGKKKVILDDRFQMIDELDLDFNALNERPSPRFMKVHLHYHLLPKAAQNGQGKIIYIARDVRDVAVSYYHFMNYLAVVDYKGTPDDMCKEFLKGTVIDGPWLDHVREYWYRRHHPNVLFVTYEDLKRKPAQEILRVGEFLGVTLSPAQVDSIIKETSFDSMKKNDAVNFSWYKENGRAKQDKDKNFMRKGITGDHKNFLSPELSEAMEKRFLEPLKKVGLLFSES